MGRGRSRKRRRVPAAEAGEEEEQAEEEEALVLPVGAEVEVRSDDPGLVGSFYEATVVGHLLASSVDGRACRRYAVVYSTLEGDHGEPLRETAAAADVRPRPPPPPPVEQQQQQRCYAMYEMVEAFHNEGWWAGVVSAVPPPPPHPGPRVYRVAFPTSREQFELEEAALRPHRVFEGGRWVPAAAAHAVDNGNPLFREGNQVEVSGSTKFFGEFWNPATVVKVIGPRNFLVQYGCVGKDGEPTTEILDSQYIRPVRVITRMDSKYRFSASSHVEVYHEGSWWPAVILEVVSSGVMKKYAVKLKSRETAMEDVECVEVLTVENTQLRPRFDWHDRKWVRYSTKKPNNGPQLMSRRRRMSVSFGLYYHGDKIRDTIRDKRSKTTDVSEPISPLSICKANYEIKHKFSSYPEEMTEQGDAVLALGSPFSLPSLPPMAGFGHPGDSSPVRRSHLEQSSSQIIIIPSVPRCAQLQASLFGAFGQPRPLPHGPVLGMQSLNPDYGSIEGSRQYQRKQSIDEGSYLMKSTPEKNINVGTGTDLSRKKELVSFQTQGTIEGDNATPKTGIAAKTIEEANNTVANSEYLAKLTHDNDDVIDLPNEATPGCGRHSEINTLSHIDPTPLKCIKASQERSEVEDLQQGSNIGEIEHGSTKDTVMIEHSMLCVASTTSGNTSDVNASSSESTAQYGSKMAKFDKGAINVEQNSSEEFCQGSLVLVHNAEVHSLPSEKSCLGTRHADELVKDMVGTGSSNKQFADNEQHATPRQVHSSAMLESASESSQSIEIEPGNSLAITEGVKVTPACEYVTRRTQDSSLTLSPAQELVPAHESVMDDRLPFMKTSPVWAQIEAMEIFNKVPQQPNFHQFEQQGPELREGMALGLMFSFANLAESINRLNVGDADEVFEEKMKGLSILEANGFDVAFLRSRLETLLHIKKNQAKARDALKKLEEEIARKQTDDRLLGTQIHMLTAVVNHLELHSYLLRDMLRSAILQKMNNAMEISGLRTEAFELERSYPSSAAPGPL